MAHTKRLFIPAFYLLLASIATSIFFSALSLINSLGITFHYYRTCTLEATFLSRQLDLYASWISTVIVILAVTGLTILCGKVRPVEYLPIPILAAGIVILASGSTTLATTLILVGEMLVLASKSIYQTGSHLFSKKRIHALMLTYLLSSVLLIEFPALLYWATAAINPSNTLGRGAAFLETNLTYTLSPLSPWLYAALLFAWIWIPCVLFLRRRITGKAARSIRESNTSAVTAKVEARKRSKAQLFAILFLLGLSVFVGYYPYWHNPEWLVGTDVYWIYKNPLDGIAGMSGLARFEQALKEHQSILLLVLLGAMETTGLTSYTILRYMPTLLTMMTALATFWFVNQLQTSTETSLLSAIASIMWIPTTIGIFTSLLANWSAVILWTIFLAVLMKRDSKTHVASAAILGSLFSLAILFIHPWSWGPFAAVTSLYLLATLLRRRFSNHQLTFCITFDLVGLAAGYVSFLMLKTSPRAFIADTLNYYAEPLRNPGTLLTFPDAIKYFTTMWSPFLNPVLVIVAIAGVLATLRNGGGRSRLTLSWLCVTSLASILATALGYWGGGFLWRVIFIAPMAILTALGASYICRTLERKLGEDSHVTLPSTHWRWAAEVIVSVLATSVISFVMSAVLPEVGQLLSLILSLLLVTVFFHRAYNGTGTSLILSVAIALVIANSGLRSLQPLLVDPHNIVLG